MTSFVNASIASPSAPRRRVAEADEDLVEHDVVEDRHAGLRRASRSAIRRAMGAAALDQLGQPVPPERAQRGVDREAAGAARRLGAPS